MPEFSRIAIARLKSNTRNARTHSKRQVRQIADSITQFGFVNPIVIDEDDVVIAGHGRLEAARQLGLSEVPVITVLGLSDTKKRLLMLADNKIAANAGWDREKLAIELGELSAEIEVEGLDISLTGFEVPEVDAIMGDFAEAQTGDEAFAEPSGPAVSRDGDIWILGQHRLACGNARSHGGARQTDGAASRLDDRSSILLTIWRSAVLVAEARFIIANLPKLRANSRRTSSSPS